MNQSEYEIEHDRLVNLIALKKTLLTMFKNHRADQSRIDSAEGDLKALENQLDLLQRKKPI
jgi:hypothetical protein